MKAVLKLQGGLYRDSYRVDYRHSIWICSDLGAEDTEWPETIIGQVWGVPLSMGVEVNFFLEK